MALEIIERELATMRRARENFRDGLTDLEVVDFYPRDLTDAVATCLDLGMLDEIKEQMPVADLTDVLFCASRDLLEAHKMWIPLIELMRVEPSYQAALTEQNIVRVVSSYMPGGQVIAIADLGAFLLETGKDWSEAVARGLENGLGWLATGLFKGDEYLPHVVDCMNQIDRAPGMAIFTPHVETALMNAMQRVGEHNWPTWGASQKHRALRSWNESAAKRYPAIVRWLSRIEISAPFKAFAPA